MTDEKTNPIADLIAMAFMTLAVVSALILAVVFPAIWVSQLVGWYFGVVLWGLTVTGLILWWMNRKEM